MASGDLCRIDRENPYRVIHFECDDYANGVVTDVRTGEVVGRG